MKVIKLIAISLIMLFQGYTFGQEINVGADVVSRYVWRGLDIANSPSLQPTLSLSEYGFELGLWGAYALNDDVSASDEIDSWLAYSVNPVLGEFTFSVVDYYFPNAGLKLGNFKNGKGAHTLEGAVSYSGPFSALVAYNFYNDPGKNIYLEIGYPLNFDNISVNFFLGAAPGSNENPGYYGADKFSVINVGIKVSKEIKITENYTLPIFSSIIVNPKLSVAHLVFGISL
jgi:Bacterial protein of unknown function (Gcw_chp)